MYIWKHTYTHTHAHTPHMHTHGCMHEHTHKVDSSEGQLTCAALASGQKTLKSLLLWLIRNGSLRQAMYLQLAACNVPSDCGMQCTFRLRQAMYLQTSCQVNATPLSPILWLENESHSLLAPNKGLKFTIAEEKEQQQGAATRTIMCKCDPLTLWIPQQVSRTGECGIERTAYMYVPTYLRIYCK